MTNIALGFATILATLALLTATPPSLAEGDSSVPSAPSKGKRGGGGTFPDERITVGDRERAYRLVVPNTLTPQQAAPLVFAFHGLGDSKDLMPVYSQLDQLAKSKGFVLVYPNGKNRRWPLTKEWARDDVALFDALYDRIIARYNIDLNRVYLVGMSNGAYFSHLLASQRSDKIAAVAAHSGGLGLLAKTGVDVQRKYAVLVIHGDADAIVPVQEGQRTRDAYQKWGHPVEYEEVKGLNHFWARDAKINERIWKFFLAHPRRSDR